MIPNKDTFKRSPGTSIRPVMCLNFNIKKELSWRTRDAVIKSRGVKIKVCFNVFVTPLSCEDGTLKDV